MMKTFIRSIFHNVNFQVLSCSLFFVFLSGCVGNNSTTNSTSTATKAYITSKDYGHKSFQECQINSDGSLGKCNSYTDPQIKDPEGMAIYFDLAMGKPYMFISNPHANTITACDLNADGSINKCFPSKATNLARPEELLIVNFDEINFLFIGNENSLGITKCKINQGAILSECSSLVSPELVKSTTGMATLTAWDEKTDIHHKYLYMTTGNDLQDRQVLRCEINQDGNANNCAYQLAISLEHIKPGVIDGLSIHGNYMYLTAQQQNKILVCPIDNEGIVDDCKINELPGPFEITFNNSGRSTNVLPQAKAYITSFSSNSVYTCDINTDSGMLENCNIANEVKVNSPHEIVTSTEVGNIEYLGKINANFSQKTNSLKFIGPQDVFGYFGRLIGNPECGIYITIRNTSSNTITVNDYLRAQVIIKPGESHRSYYTTNYSSNDTFKVGGRVFYNTRGRVDDIFNIQMEKNSINCLATTTVSGSNNVDTPYQLWANDTPSTTIEIANPDPLLYQHRKNYKIAAAASLLAYDSVFNHNLSALKSQALADLKNAGYGDFLEVTTADTMPVAMLNNEEQNVVVYQDGNSNGLRELSQDGTSDLPISSKLITSKSSDNINGKLLLAYNQANNSVLIAYRGSANAQNWIIDATAVKTPWFVPLPEPDQTIAAYLSSAQVHFGFEVYKNALYMNAKVYNWLNSRTNSNTTYLITGHSLGGAAASLLSALLLSEGKSADKVSTITFGQPAAGNSFFALAYQLKGKYYSRIVNEYDPVGSITSPLGYMHYGYRVGLSGITDGINTHSSDGYYKASSYYAPIR